MNSIEKFIDEVRNLQENTIQVNRDIEKFMHDNRLYLTDKALAELENSIRENNVKIKTYEEVIKSNNK